MPSFFVHHTGLYLNIVVKFSFDVLCCVYLQRVCLFQHILTPNL